MKEFKPSASWVRVDFYVKFIAVVLSILGGGFAFWNYLANQDALREQRVYEIVAVFDQADTQSAISEIGLSIDRHLTDLGPNIDKSIIGELIFDGFATGSSVEKRAQFNRLWYLLRRVSHCHRNQSCDAILLEEYFCDFGVTFWRYFRDPILQRHKPNNVGEVTNFLIACER